MPTHISRCLRAFPLTLALLLVPAALALANPAYDRVAAAFAQNGGQLDACSFTQPQLEAALAGIPPEIKQYVPDLRKAMRTGIALHRSGGCVGRRPGTSTTGSAGAIPPAQTTPAPATTTTTPAPAATTPAPATTSTPATAAAPASASTGARHHSSTPVVVALAALGGLLLVLLLWWGLARLRGWEPPSLARARHGWGEAGFRTTSTWSEFTDWLRLGR
jgi:hypothetical protein